jgi:hypothetical protein
MDAVVAIFIPSLNRPHFIRETIANIHATTKIPHKIYYMISDEKSKEILEELGETYFWDAGGDTRYNTRMNYMFNHTKEPLIFTGSDDVLFHDGWIFEAMRPMCEQGYQVVIVNDLFNPRGTEALITRNYINKYSGCVDTPNVLFYPGYYHIYADTEQFETAKYRGVCIKTEDSIVEHLHYTARKRQADDTYRTHDNKKGFDRELFKSRRHLWRK